MADGADWVDLLDPSEEEIRRHAPRTLHRDALAQLVRRPAREGDVRPTLQSHGDYVFGVLVAALAVPAEDRVILQEIDVLLTRDKVVTVRKTPPDEPAFDPARVREVCDARGPLEAGAITYHLVDEVAERYLDLVDALDSEIDELEEHVDDWPSSRIRHRLSELRHDLLHIRRTLTPTRDAVRGVVDGRVDVKRRSPFGRELFPPEIERDFAGAYDKLLRAVEGLENSRDLLAAVREYHESRTAQEQSETVKRLTAIASLLLFPTFWVGVYGQNFDHMPELRWRLGYLFSWAVIVGVTVLQLVFFRRRRWL